jgi:hypothetical protein
VIVVNPTPSPVRATFTPHGLGYRPGRVEDYFTRRAIGRVEDGRFRVTLPEGETAVYRLARGE